MAVTYTALDIANYILWYANSKRNDIRDITNLKLQKLLYYVAATYYVEHEKRLFNETIEKWKYGPVVPSIYQTFRSYSYGHIDSPSPTYKVNSDKMFSLEAVPFSPDKFESDKALENNVKKVLDKIGSLSSFALIEKTHKEHAWADFANKILMGERNLTYSDGELRKSQIHL